MINTTDNILDIKSPYIKTGAEKITEVRNKISHTNSNSANIKNDTLNLADVRNEIIKKIVGVEIKKFAEIAGQEIEEGLQEFENKITTDLDNKISNLESNLENKLNQKLESIKSAETKNSNLKLKKEIHELNSKNLETSLGNLENKIENKILEKMGQIETSSQESEERLENIGQNFEEKFNLLNQKINELEENLNNLEIYATENLGQGLKQIEQIVKEETLPILDNISSDSEKIINVTKIMPDLIIATADNNNSAIQQPVLIVNEVSNTEIQNLKENMLESLDTLEALVEEKIESEEEIIEEKKFEKELAEEVRDNNIINNNLDAELDETSYLEKRLKEIINLFQYDGLLFRKNSYNIYLKNENAKNILENNEKTNKIPQNVRCKICEIITGFYKTLNLKIESEETVQEFLIKAVGEEYKNKRKKYLQNKLESLVKLDITVSV